MLTRAAPPPESLLIFSLAEPIAQVCSCVFAQGSRGIYNESDHAPSPEDRVAKTKHTMEPHTRCSLCVCAALGGPPNTNLERGGANYARNVLLLLFGVDFDDRMQRH